MREREDESGVVLQTISGLGAGARGRHDEGVAAQVGEGVTWEQRS